jgi:DNA-binding transcriptional regulator YiaG
MPQTQSPHAGYLYVSVMYLRQSFIRMPLESPQNCLRGKGIQEGAVSARDCQGFYDVFQRLAKGMDGTKEPAIDFVKQWALANGPALGGLVHFRRRGLRLNQAEMANYLGLSYRRYAQWERQRHKLGRGHLETDEGEETASKSVALSA